jgi:tRNA threonylcarbamoyladenosine biosynthesis protein TsaB
MAACSVAVRRDGGEVVSRYEARERGHAEALFPMINAVMGEAGLDYADLTRVAATVGPGSFTGVRAGVAAARGIALAANVEALGVMSLDVLAEGCRTQTDAASREGGFAVAQDARRGELYLALYSASGERISEAQALAPAVAAGLLPEGLSFVAGTGGEQLAYAAAAIGRIFPVRLRDLQPHAAWLLKLALSLEGSSGPLSPVYLRPPGAEPQDGKMLARQDK